MVLGRPLQGWLLAFVTSSAMLAGCADEAAPVMDDIEAPVVAALDRPEDYTLDAGGDVAGTFAREWRWQVHEWEHTELTVFLRFDSPFHALERIEAVLLDPHGQERGRYDGALTAGPQETLLDIHMAPWQKVPVGNWTLGFRGSGVASYDLDIAAVYHLPPEAAAAQAAAERHE